jgi:hypothetical protein
LCIGWSARRGCDENEPGNCRWTTPKEQRANQGPMSEEHKEKSRANLIKARKARWEKYRAIESPIRP